MCLYLPDGRVAFMFRRPQVTSNDAFDAAGMRFEVVEPFVELRVSYEGAAVVLDDPLQMADPRQAFTSNPHTRCAVHLVYRGVRPCSAVSPTSPPNVPARNSPADTTNSWSRRPARCTSATSSGSCTASGCATTAGAPATGRPRGTTAGSPATSGGRSASWARASPDATGPGTRGGFVWDGDTMHLCRDFRIRSTWDGDARYHRSIEAELVTDERTWVVRGSVLTAHSAAQPPHSTPTATSSSHGSPKGSRSGPSTTGASATGCRSTSTRSSTGPRSGLAE